MRKRLMPLPLVLVNGLAAALMFFTAYYSQEFILIYDLIIAFINVGLTVNWIREFVTQKDGVK